MSAAEQSGLVVGPLTAQDDRDNNAATDEQRRRAGHYFEHVPMDQWPKHWVDCLNATTEWFGTCSEIVYGVLLKCIRHDDALSAGGAE